IERLREHDRVVRHALGSATPLPLRFGSRFASEDDARATLRDRRDEFLASLERVRGRVEMGLRIERAGSRPTTAALGGAGGDTAGSEGSLSPGRAYLERRRATLDARSAEVAEAEAILRDVDAELADLGLPSVVTVTVEG